MNEARLEPGTILAEKYRLESVLGVGGMGTVYRAEHLALKAPVAIKVIDREVAEGDVALARFMREAQSAASLRSPHVVQILDYGMEGKRPFMVMEMLEGEPLAARIKRLGRLTPAETYRVISHIARAVSRAHEADIIHRDLKPDNVFLVHNEGDEIAKVLDFGVAKVESTQLDGEGHTRTGSLLGTPYYMSPEQAQGNKHIDARSDLWALGVIAFECLTGKRPFSSDGLGDLVLQICIRDIPVPSHVLPVPPGFDAWFQKACTRNPDERFQTARELALELRPALGLGNDAGSIPESRWSTVASMRHGPRQSEILTLGSETTQPDPSEPHWPTADPQAKTLDSRPGTTDQTAPSSRTPQPEERSASRWEVVPHHTMSDVSRENLDDPIVPLEEHSGGNSIAFVAIIALLIGGAVVFGLRQAGFSLPGQSEDRPQSTTFRPTPLSEKQQQNKSTKNAPRKFSKTSAAKPASPPGSPEGDPSELDATAEAEKAEETKDGPSTEDEALEAIDAAAEKAAEGRDAASKDGAPKDGEAPNADGKKTPGEEAKDKPTPAPAPDPGPQPTLPDGLAPAPKPPPPPTK